MGTFYCQNCGIWHSIMNGNGIAVCPICNRENVKVCKNGTPFNVISAGNSIQCTVCGMKMTLSVMSTNGVLRGCLNGCSQVQQPADVSLYNYCVYSDDKTEYIRNNFLAVLDVARSGFGTEMKEDDVLEHLSSPDIMVVCTCNKAIVAFATVILFGDMLYLHGMVVATAYQGCGIGKNMLRKAIENTGNVQYLTLTTQNPYMYSLASSFCDVIFPNSFSVPREDMINKINAIADKLSIRLSSCQDGKFLIKNRYTQSLYQRLPGIEESAVFKNNLRVRHWRSRDALLLFGRLKQN